MQRYRITNTKSGADFGIYAGINEAAALDAMYRDAGYANRASYIEEFSDDEHDASIDYWRVDLVEDQKV